MHPRIATARPNCQLIDKQLSFGRWLSHRLAGLHVSVATFAAQASYTRAAIYRLMNDDHPPARSRRPALALLLGVTEAQLSKRIAVTWPHDADATAKASA